MKKAFSIITILAFVISLASCGNKKKKTEEKPGYHTHEDGTVHRDDEHKHDAKPNQETFEVKADEDAEHKHEGDEHDHDGHKHDSDEHDHDHGDASEHDHDHEHGDHK